MFKKLTLSTVAISLLVILAVPAFAVILPLPTRTLRPTTQVKGVFKDPGDGTTLISTNGNVYTADRNVTVTDDVRGDLIVAGGTVVVKGRISGNVYVAGGGIEIDNDINGDLTAFGGSVIVNGTVRGDIRVAGGEVYINSTRVGGDLIVAAGKTAIAQGVKVSGIDRIAGETDGSMRVVRDAKGNPTELSQTSYNFNVSSTKAVKPSATAVAIGVLISAIVSLLVFFGGIIAAYLVLRLFPTFSESTLHEMRKDPLRAILVGILSGFGFCFVMMLLAFSVVGWQLFALSALMATIAAYIAGFYAQYSIGRFILVQLKHPHTGRLYPLVLGMVLTAIVFWVIDFLPFIGGMVSAFIWLILISWGVGAMLLNKYNALKKH
jgi:hypothetical protein